MAYLQSSGGSWHWQAMSDTGWHPQALTACKVCAVNQNIGANRRLARLSEEAAYGQRHEA